MTFDTRIGAALIFAILLQSATALLWAGRAAARLDDLEQRLELQRPVAERLARLEAQMGLAQESLHRIEARVEKR